MYWPPLGDSSSRRPPCCDRRRKTRGRGDDSPAGRVLYECRLTSLRDAFPVVSGVRSCHVCGRRVPGSWPCVRVAVVVSAVDVVPFLIGERSCSPFGCLWPLHVCTRSAALEHRGRSIIEQAGVSSIERRRLRTANAHER